MVTYGADVGSVVERWAWRGGSVRKAGAEVECLGGGSVRVRQMTGRLAQVVLKLPGLPLQDE